MRPAVSALLIAPWLLACDGSRAGRADGAAHLDTGPADASAGPVDARRDARGQELPDATAQGDLATPDRQPAADVDQRDTRAVHDSASDEAGHAELRLSVLSYNVAGLPQALSSSDPETNTPLISPLLNAYDLVLVQEDFWYHAALAAAVTLPYQSEPMLAEPSLARMGDGLNRFSRFAFAAALERVTWVECNGITSNANDCLTTKGFSYARHALDPWHEVGVYNLHMDAGRDPGDAEARDAQVTQLVAHIAGQAPDLALIVGGDTNLKTEDEADAVILRRLIEESGLSDTCRTLGCGDPDRIDRVLLRDGGRVKLTPLRWSLAPEFVDAQGAPLSDHEAVVVELSAQLL